MKRFAVTGATGFLGRALVTGLREGGAEVVAIARRPDDALEALGATFVAADVTGERDRLGDDTKSLADAFAGCEGVYHMAGFVSRDARDTREMMRVHVDGTKAVLCAAKEAGVRRVVVASSSGTHAVSREPEPVLDETAPDAVELVGRWPYYLSKIYQERVARQFARELDLDVVLINPSLLLGPGDERQSSTEDVVRFLFREIPAVPPGGLAFVDVRDAAQGALQAMARGERGERYLLNGANLTFAEFFGRLSRVSKVPAPVLRVPSKLARAGATLLEHFYRARNSEPPISRLEVEMGEVYWYCDARKAETQLGFQARDPAETLDETVRDLRARFPRRV